MAKYTKEESEKAIDLYIRYCKEATKVKFITLSQLATRLLEAKKTGRIERLLETSGPWTFSSLTNGAIANWTR